jgi:hypothetical protein
MKNILIAIFIYFTISDVKCQPYTSIFGNNLTSWNTKQSQLFGDYTDSLFYVGDTTINNQLLKKFNLFSLGQITPGYSAFIKEDTITGRAWYFSTVDTTTQLIMDLSLQLNDSFMVNDFSSMIPSTYYLVDSVYYESGRKHIRLNYVFQFFPINQSIGEKFLMIEGVGTNLGVKYQDIGIINFASYLLCQYKDLAYYYGNVNPSYTNVCQVLTANKKQFIMDKNFEVFPNPTNSLIYIKSNNVNEEIRSLTIYNLTGQKIFQSVNFIKDFTTQINLEDFDRGMYTLIIETSTDIKQFKIIKN